MIVKPPSEATTLTKEMSTTDIIQQIESLNSESYLHRSKRPEESLRLAKKALWLAVEHGHERGWMKARVNIGFYHMYKGKHREAAEMFTEILFEAEDKNHEDILASVHYNLGVLYFRIAQLDDAISYMQKARAYFEFVENDVQIAKCQFQFASIRFELKQYQDALELAKIALRIEEKVGNDNSLAAVLTLKGRIYQKLGEKKKASENFQRSYVLRQIEGDLIGFSSTVYYQISYLIECGDLDQAETLIEDSVDLFEKIEFPLGKALFQQMRGKFYSHKEKWNEAIDCHKKAIKISDEFDLKSLSVESYQDISNIYEHTGDLKMALKYQKWYMNSKEEAMTYRSKIQLDNIRLHREVTSMKKDAQLERFKREEMSKVTESIAKMHDELKSSVAYAKRIQKAIMPKEKDVQSELSLSFLLNEPKEMVSGDFFWTYKSESAQYFAVADCTGHGVPGAILSVYATNALNAAISQRHLIEPADILNDVRASFAKDFMSEEVTLKDGMDIALIKLEKGKITFAGAYRPLFIVRNGVLIEYRGDRQPVGLFLKMNPFSQTTIDLELNDQVYLFTDGMTDQIGGEKLKKLKSKTFKTWLLESANESPEIQKETLLYRFENWQGSLDQTDDMMLFSFRVDEKLIA